MWNLITGQFRVFQTKTFISLQSKIILIIGYHKIKFVIEKY